MSHLQTFKNLKMESGEDGGSRKRKSAPPISGHIT